MSNPNRYLTKRGKVWYFDRAKAKKRGSGE